MSEYEVVERPERALTSLIHALMETAATGKALRVTGTTQMKLSGGRSQLLKARGFRLRTKKDGDAVIAWCDVIAPKNGHPA